MNFAFLDGFADVRVIVGPAIEKDPCREIAIFLLFFHAGKRKALFADRWAAGRSPFAFQYGFGWILRDQLSRPVTSAIGEKFEVVRGIAAFGGRHSTAR